MKRWKITVGLGGLALGALWLAPRLFAPMEATTPAPAPEPLPTPSPAAPSGYDGHLSMQARIDQTVLLEGDRSDRFVTVEVTGHDDNVTRTVRRPLDVAVVLDASGSMREAGKLDQAIQATVDLAHALTPADTLSVVAFSESARVLLTPDAVRNPDAVASILRDLHAHGGTNLFAGIDVGARTLAGRPGATQHLLVLSDGRATVGELRPERFAARASQLASERISLSTVGLGSSYNEDLLASLADLGGGRYAHVASGTQIAEVFAQTFARSATLLGQGARVDLMLPPGLEPVDLLGWAGQRIDGGWSVYLGDVSAGERRKIVVRARPSGTSWQDQAIEARLTYHDVIDRRAADELDRVSVRTSTDASEAQQTFDPAVAALGRRTYGNWYLEMATRSYADGDRSGSLDLIDKGRRVLEEAAEEMPMPELDQDLDRFDRSRDLYKRQAPSAPSARREVIQTKERFRAIAR